MPEVTTYRVENQDGIHEFVVEPGRGLVYSSYTHFKNNIILVDGRELQRFAAWLTRQVDEKFPLSRTDPY